MLLSKAQKMLNFQFNVLAARPTIYVSENNQPVSLIKGAHSLRLVRDMVPHTDNKPSVNTGYSMDDPIFREVCLPASDRPRYILLPTERKHQFFMELGKYEYSYYRLIVEIMLTYHHHPYFRYMHKGRFHRFVVSDFVKTPTLVENCLYDMYEMQGVAVKRRLRKQ